MATITQRSKGFTDSLSTLVSLVSTTTAVAVADCTIPTPDTTLYKH